MNGRHVASKAEVAEQSAGTQEFVDHFLHPDRNDAGKYPRGITLLRNAAVNHRRSPMVLPWLNEQTQRMAYYVIPRQREQLTSVRDLLVAFVGPSLAKYGYDVPVALDRPNEAPILERYGTGSTFVVQATTDTEERKRLRTALERMVKVVERSPERAWSAPKPLGRLLADFEAALLSGAPRLQRRSFSRSIAKAVSRRPTSNTWRSGFWPHREGRTRSWHCEGSEKCCFRTRLFR
ncbi:hypothetical protein SHIRM173S_05091 [Streptomyces hirsutus]